MNGLSIVAGVGPRVTFAGRAFQIRGKTNAYYADVEAAIKKLRGNPLDLVVEAGKRASLEKNPDVLDSVAKAVADKFRNWNTTTYVDYIEFMGTPEGDALTIYHAIKDDAPDVTFEQVKFWMVQTRFYGGESGRAKLDEIFKAIATASGEDQLGNLSGQPGPEPTATTVPSTGS